MAKAKTTKADESYPSESLQNEARELGIEPSGYHTTNQLQERVDQVRAEKEAVGGDTSMTDARKEQRETARAEDASNDNLSNATDAEAAATETKPSNS